MHNISLNRNNVWGEDPGSWNYEEVSLISSPNDVGYYLRGFGQDDDGEIYLAVSSMLGPQGNTGKVFKLVQRQVKYMVAAKENTIYSKGQ